MKCKFVAVTREEDELCGLTRETIFCDGETGKKDCPFWKTINLLSRLSEGKKEGE